MNPIKLLQEKNCNTENKLQYRKKSVFTENKNSVKHVSYKIQKKFCITVFSVKLQFPIKLPHWQ